jgi:prepilin-type N-terminal cleavage/methylation domain-containing protein
MTRGRAGFTFIELIVVAVVGSLILFAALQVLITNRRMFTAQSATISGQQSTRMAVEILFAELREVSPGGGDIISMASDEIRVRLMRKFASVCAITYSPQPLLLVFHPTPSSRKFHTGDSIFAWADNEENVETDDVWIPARVTAVDSFTTAVGLPVCPQDLAPASLLTFNGQAAAFAADSVRVGAPVRSYIEYTFGVTNLMGDPYLGRQTQSGPMVPIAGPLRTGNGLQFTYRDSLGTVTNVPTDVRQIEVTVRTGSRVLNSLGQMVSDSVTVWIHSRN